MNSVRLFVFSRLRSQRGVSTAAVVAVLAGVVTLLGAGVVALWFWVGSHREATAAAANEEPRPEAATLSSAAEPSPTVPSAVMQNRPGQAASAPSVASKDAPGTSAKALADGREPPPASSTHLAANAREAGGTGLSAPPATQPPPARSAGTGVVAGLVPPKTPSPTTGGPAKPTTASNEGGEPVKKPGGPPKIKVVK